MMWQALEKLIKSQKIRLYIYNQIIIIKIIIKNK